MPSLTVKSESWPIDGAFTISRGSKDSADVVVVELCSGQDTGRGECVPYARYGESVDEVIDLIESIRDPLHHGLDREELQKLLPPGAARNAVDCAFWDLEAKQSGQRSWQIAGYSSLDPVSTAYTLSLDSPANMKVRAAEHADMPLLKLKLAGSDDLQRVKAVREGAPKSRIIVDANEGWTPKVYRELAPRLRELGVEMIEQPLPAGDDEALRTLPKPLTVCADESCHAADSLPDLIGKYDMINIKLDKTGGLTEALKLADAASTAGLQIMVGCMLATSLAMAPAIILAQQAQVVDLDGPLLLQRDRPNGLHIAHARISPPDRLLWG